MKVSIPQIALAALALAVLVAAVATAADPEAPSPGGAPVVVELFTSQGCSSCPAADRLLTSLAADRELAGRIIPLSFHVDYWNYIGWQDPFSSERWSVRQRRYGRAFKSNRVYTPQLVVNGTSECVGSDEREVRKRLAKALAEPPAGRVGVKLAQAAAGSPVTVAVEARLDRRVERDQEVWVALWETGLSTPVGSGENASRTLRNDYVVRYFQKALTLPAAGGPPRSGQVSIPLDPKWKRANLGVAAFLQDPTTLAIHGAVSRRLAG